MPQAPAPYTKTQALADLRTLAAKATGLRFADLPPPLRRAVHRHWGSMVKARQAARLPARRPGRAPHWTKDRVLAAIRGMARRGQHMSQSALMRSGQGRLVSAASQLFGTFARARDLAGVQLAKRRPAATNAWDADAVVATIRARQRDGETLAVTKCPSSLVSAAQRIFGAWRDAVEAAGLDYDQVRLRRDYSDDELLDWLRQLALTHPAMTLYDLDRFGEHTVACRRRWGSLERAASTAGLTSWPVRVHHEAMSEDEIVTALRQMARAGVPLALSRVRNNPANRRLVDGAAKRFLSWDDALAAAGLPSQQRDRPAARTTRAGGGATRMRPTP